MKSWVFSNQRSTEIAVLRAHIVNYAKTRDAYAAYRKAGYSKKFLEAHREEIELHKAAKAAFDEADLKKLPKVKDLNVEYFELLSQKKAAYPEYRKAKEEMQELVRAQKNVERFFAEEKDSEKDPEQTGDTTEEKTPEEENPQTTPEQMSDLKTSRAKVNLANRILEGAFGCNPDLFFDNNT